ncbi:MAG: hypothetical protein OXE99_03980 [Cellvibrionales bacterium]|nr:hypothetical protein [Cellvibrionales bacterium]
MVIKEEPSSVYIDGITYQFGEIACDISREAESFDGPDKAWADLILQNGMKTYYKSNQCCLDFSSSVARSSVDSFGCSAADIDSVIFTSYSYRSQFSHSQLSQDGFNFSKYIQSKLTKEIDFINAEFFGVFLTESGNFASLIRAARNLILAEGKRNILCINVDKIPKTPTQRRGALSGVMTNTDVVAAFIVSSEKGQFKVEGVSQVFSPYLNTLGRGEGLKKQMEIMRGISDSASNTLSKLGHSPKDYTSLLMNNYSLELMRQFAGYMGFSEDILFSENLPKFAHAFTADNIINLSTITPKLNTGDRVFMLSGGTTNWGTCSVQKL